MSPASSRTKIVSSAHLVAEDAEELPEFDYAYGVKIFKRTISPTFTALSLTLPVLEFQPDMGPY